MIVAKSSNYTLSGKHAGGIPSYLAGDIELFNPMKLPVSTADLHYAAIPPEIHLEVDVNTEMERFTDEQYIAKKTTKLLEFGVKKVIWILSGSKTVIIAASDTDRQVVDWAEDVEVADGIRINVGRYLKEQGSPFA